MIDLSKYIYELLRSHECVVVPGLGGFIIRKKNAVIYVAQNLFAPPSKHLHFNPQLTHNDGLLAHHISKETGSSYEKALDTINETVSDILYKLYKEKSVDLKDIGIISNQNGFLKFEPSSESNLQDESYGLNSFIMPMLHSDRDRKRPIIVHKERKKSQRKPIKSYQVAAVITFLLLSIGGYLLQTDQIRDYMKSSFYPQISLVVKDFFTEKQTIPTIDNIVLSEEQPITPENEEALDIAHVEENITTSNQDESVSFTPKETSNDIESSSVETTSTVADILRDSFIQTPVFGQYYIIIGAFKQPNLAENLCKQMRANGYPTAFILDIPTSDFCRVSLQSFNNLASAQESLRDVKQIQEDAWVLKWKY